MYVRRIKMTWFLTGEANVFGFSLDYLFIIKGGLEDIQVVHIRVQKFRVRVES